MLVHFANDGNTLLKPRGSVTILQGGKAIEHLPFKMDTFLPQTAIDYPVLLKKALGGGRVPDEGVALLSDAGRWQRRRSPPRRR